MSSEPKPKVAHNPQIKKSMPDRKAIFSGEEITKYEQGLMSIVVEDEYAHLLKVSDLESIMNLIHEKFEELFDRMETEDIPYLLIQDIYEKIGEFFENLSREKNLDTGMSFKTFDKIFTYLESLGEEFTKRRSLIEAKNNQNIEVRNFLQLSEGDLFKQALDLKRYFPAVFKKEIPRGDLLRKVVIFNRVLDRLLKRLSDPKKIKDGVDLESIRGEFVSVLSHLILTNPKAKSMRSTTFLDSVDKNRATAFLDGVQNFFSTLFEEDSLVENNDLSSKFYSEVPVPEEIIEEKKPSLDDTELIEFINSVDAIFSSISSTLENDPVLSAEENSSIKVSLIKSINAFFDSLESNGNDILFLETFIKDFSQNFEISIIGQPGSKREGVAFVQKSTVDNVRSSIKKLEDFFIQRISKILKYTDKTKKPSEVRFTNFLAYQDKLLKPYINKLNKAWTKLFALPIANNKEEEREQEELKSKTNQELRKIVRYFLQKLETDNVDQDSLSTEIVEKLNHIFTNSFRGEQKVTKEGFFYKPYFDPDTVDLYYLTISDILSKMVHNKKNDHTTYN
jgi:hypothetical protein